MTNHEIKTSVIGRIVVIVPEFKSWTGTRAMHEGDFTIGADGKLPPKEVAKSLGLKAIIDRSHLRPFDRIRHRADALLSSCGVRYLSGWAVPKDKSEDVLRELDGIVRLYEEARDAFVAGYDTFIDEWAQQNPSFAQEIIDGKLDKSDVASRFSAGYEAFCLQPVTEAKANDLVKSIGGLAEELIDDVSLCARTFFRESFLGKTRANRKTVNALIRLRDRVNGLSFLSGNLYPLVKMIDEVTVQMPKEGYFDGDAFWKLSSVVQTLGDRKLLEEIIRKEVQITGLTAPSGFAELPSGIGTTESSAPKLDAKLSEEPFDVQPDLMAGIDAFFKGDGVPNQSDKSPFSSKTERGDGSASAQVKTGFDSGFILEKQSEEIGIQAEVPNKNVVPSITDVDVGEGMYF